MKALSTIVLLLGVATAAWADDASVPAIIPQPQHIERRAGTFHLRANTRILVDATARPTGKYLAAWLKRSTGYNLAVTTADSARAVRGAILLTTQRAPARLGPEGYELRATPRAVVIRAPHSAGVFYGMETLLQLLPPQIDSRTVVQRKWTLPCVRIRDWPRFQWRGMMLDVSRHFYTKQQVERILDLMARYKLNRFHWHLVDSVGWRIQIKKYPRLTSVGAWRKGIGYGLNPKASTAYGPDGRYGGFYTQADIREVVAYAHARHITVVPEIEMPGHSGAALEAYPQFNCITTNGQRAPNIGEYCAGNDGTFTFLENVLTEVFQLFPTKYIHIGGDEVSKANWKKCPLCQARMKALGLTNVKQLQSYFIKRIEKFVNAHGHTLIGWSEILEGGLAKNAVVMDWIGGAKAAATSGHDVIMSPTGYCYFDHYQSLDHSLEPRAIGGYLPLHRVYSFDPIPADLPAKDDHYVLGGQANVWTEYIASPKHLDYMIFPRLGALAEAVWSSKRERNWGSFLRRLKVEEQRLSELGVVYRHFHTVAIGTWGPEKITTRTGDVNWDVTAHITQPGKYHVTFNYTGGRDGIHIRSVKLISNGQTVAESSHLGFAGANPRNPVYVLNLPHAVKGAHYVLQAEVAGSGGRDSHGLVSWIRVPENAGRNFWEHASQEE